MWVWEGAVGGGRSSPRLVRPEGTRLATPLPIRERGLLGGVRGGIWAGS